MIIREAIDVCITIMRGVAIIIVVAFFTPIWVFIGSIYHIGKGETPFAFAEELDKLIEWIRSTKKKL